MTQQMAQNPATPPPITDTATLETVSTTAEMPKATPVTFAVHSTPGFQNNVLFFRTMDDCNARWLIVRVLVEQGSGVAMMAAHWCKYHNVKLVVVLWDKAIAQVEDRPRRYRQISAYKPHVALMFNQADHWLQYAQILHEGGCAVSFARPGEGNKPDYLRWTPGMIRVPPTPSLKALAADSRKGRPRRLLTEDEKKKRKAEARQRDADIRHAKRLLNNPTGQIQAIARGRPKKRR